jgi:hypothetical protein
MVLQMKSTNPMSTEFTSTGKRSAPASSKASNKAPRPSAAADAAPANDENSVASAVDSLALPLSGDQLAKMQEAALQGHIKGVTTDLQAKEAEVEFWKGEYAKLSELRFTQAEQQMKLMKEWADDRIRAMQGQIT